MKTFTSRLWPYPVHLARLALIFSLAVSAAGTSARPAASFTPKPELSYATIKYEPASPDVMRWWEDAKFGLFVHWGVYSVAGGVWSQDGTFESRFGRDAGALVPVKGYAEQLLKGAQLPLGEYQKIAGIFDWSKFNAQDLVNLCFASGQHYIVITTKHHDGFAMWRSKASPWNIGDATPYGRTSGRDPLKELADACHATKTNGSPWEIKLCFYYSHCADWWEDDGVAFGYAPHRDPDGATFQHYLDRKVKPQLTELLTNYGEIGMIWFDVPRVLSVEQAQQLRDLVHRLSPTTIINGRLGHDLGNYVNTGDNGTVGVAADAPWETGSSLNESYGYKIDAREYKTPAEIIAKLIQVIAHGGNYLLNVGPRGDGTIPDRDRQILTEVGKWTRANGEAIFGTRATPYTGASAFHPAWGECTQKGPNLYLFVTRWPKEGRLVVPLLQNRIKRVSLVADRAREPLSYQRATDANGNDTVVIRLPDQAPHGGPPVIAIEGEGDQLELAALKAASDPAQGTIYLDAANFQAHAAGIKALSLYYDPEQKAVVNWRRGKGADVPVVSWTYDVPATGVYKIEIDYALSRRFAGMPVSVFVDHQKSLTFFTQDTGGENVCRRIAVGSVTLKAGRQDLALASPNTDANKLFVMQRLQGIRLTRQ